MFNAPHWLVLLIIVFWFCFAFKAVKRSLFYLHIAALALLIFALAGFQLPLKSKDGAVIVVADRSLSMPNGSRQQISETINILSASKNENSKLGVVSFGERVSVDVSLEESSFSGFSSLINGNGSNLALALNKALQLVPKNTAAEILVLSDGMYTGESPKKAAFKAAAMGIPISYRFLGSNEVFDTAVVAFEAPNLLEAGEAFVISASIYSPIEQTANIKLFCCETEIASVDKRLKRGLNSLSFSHTAPNTVNAVYKIRVSPQNGQDKIPQNNEAKLISQIRQIKPILVISENANTPLKELLTRAGRQTEVKKSSDLTLSCESLSAFSAVIIENISAERLGLNAMQALKAYVQYMGGGLMLTGGEHAFGAGGYYKSPLEDILPVSLKLSAEKRKIPIALVIALDNSGSMSERVMGGRLKIELANMGAASSFDLLMPSDEFSLLAVDTKVREVIPLSEVKNIKAARNKILSVGSGGGGIYVEEALTHACSVLLNSPIKNRHIILFADASDANKPGSSAVLLSDAAKNGITCSIVGLGRKTDADADVLRDIAKAGNGRIFFCSDPLDLPRLFAQDTFIAAKMAYSSEPVKIKINSAIAELVDEPKITSSQIAAYNIVNKKPSAITPIYALNKENSPILAAHQQGLGRVACYMGLVSNGEGEEFLKTSEGAKIISGLASYIANDDRESLNGMAAKQKICGGEWQLNLYFDAEQENELFSSMPVVTLIKSAPNADPETQRLVMKHKAADCLSASAMLGKNETVIAAVQAGKSVLIMPPICQMYSHEFAHQGLNKGKRLLAELASITGGSEIFDAARVYKAMPVFRRFRPMPELIYAAIIIILIEIIERRTGFFSYIFSLPFFNLTSRPKKLKEKTKALKPAKTSLKSPALNELLKTEAEHLTQKGLNRAEEAKNNSLKQETKSEAFSDALKKAKRRAAARGGK